MNKVTSRAMWRLKRERAVERDDLRVLLLNLSTGGLGRYGASLAKALSGLVTTRILVAEELLQNSVIGDYLAEADVRVVSAITKGTTWQRTHSMIQILKEARSYQPTLIHDLAGSGMRNLLPLRPFLHSVAPIFVTEHDPQPHSGMDSFTVRFSQRLTLRMSTGVIVHGSHCRETLVSLGVCPQRIVTHPHGPIDLFLHRQENRERQERDSILFFGPLRPNKGVEKLISIIRRVRERQPDAKFIIAGSPNPGRVNAESRWRLTIENFLREVVTIPGVELHPRFIPDHEVASFFERASIVILPYKDATQSGIVTVAGLFGCATVATDVGDLSEAIDNGRTGLIVERENEEVFSEAVLKLLQDPALCRRMGDTARELFMGPLSWNRIAEHLVSEYLRILALP